MKNKKILKLIEAKQELRNIFAESKVSSPIKRQMAKFMHLNLLERNDIFKGFSRFKPEDLK